MAHFAQLDENNVVLNVIVVDNSILLNENNEEEEQLGINFLTNLYGSDTIWKQTSYNGNFRKDLASITGTYDPTNDVFIMPKPFNSWTLNDNFDWEAPVAYPDDNEIYFWDEDNQNWVLP
tara:strand:+ start:151 stop:510 length:360 start_codon:yes stop_codon:yes gene_type:complete